VFRYDPASRGARAYLALAGELVRREQEMRAAAQLGQGEAASALSPT
jgi:hypothetical protein